MPAQLHDLHRLHGHEATRMESPQVTNRTSAATVDCYIRGTAVVAIEQRLLAALWVSGSLRIHGQIIGAQVSRDSEPHRPHCHTVTLRFED
jgi:hypothetical protein